MKCSKSKTPVYAADVIVTYQVLPEKSAWLYANVSDIKNLVGDELVASAIKSAMAELEGWKDDLWLKRNLIPSR